MKRFEAKLLLLEAIEDYRDDPCPMSANKVANLCVILAGYAFEGESRREYDKRMANENLGQD
jgi:hypothetical protein